MLIIFVLLNMSRKNYSFGADVTNQYISRKYLKALRTKYFPMVCLFFLLKYKFYNANVFQRQNPD